MNVRGTRTVAGWVAFVALLAAIFGSCAMAGSQTPDARTFAKLRAAWVQDLSTKQLEPILKFYAPEAVFFQPNGDRIKGSVALRNLFQMIFATFNSDLTLHSENLEVSGNLAYDSGSFDETLTNIGTGARINSKGSYVIIYKRQPNGSWLIVQHVWTGTPPPGT
jgi:ketosteroid isomerase-like protein